MSDAILWLERDGKRWRLESFKQVLRWVSGGGELGYCWVQRDALLPGGGNVNDDHGAITRDEAIALIRRYAPAFGYVVRERVVAGAWVRRGGDHFRYVPTGRVASGLSLARVAPTGGWWCWDTARIGPAASGPETGPAGMAAADRWLTEHAPWVTLEGGAFTVPPEPVPTVEPGSDADWAEALRVVREVMPEAQRDGRFLRASPDGPVAIVADVTGLEARTQFQSGPVFAWLASDERLDSATGAARRWAAARKAASAPATAAPAADDRLDALAARVAALEAARGSVATERDPRVDPKRGDVLWYGGTAYLVTKADDGCVCWSWMDVRGNAKTTCDEPIEYWRRAFKLDGFRVLWVAP